jgi:hypothetical protein
MAVALRVMIIEYPHGYQKPFCTNVSLSEDAMLLYRVVLVALQYLTPLCIISCVYIRMALTLWGSKTPGNAQISRDATFLKNKKKVSPGLVRQRNRGSIPGRSKSWVCSAYLADCL